MKKFATVFIVLILAACNKDELPKSNIGTPSFISNVNLDGADYSLAAGENGLVLQTSVSTTDTNAVFVSDLSNSACTNCGPALKLTINSPETFLPAAETDWIAELNSWPLSLESESGESTTALAVSIDNGNEVSQGNWYLNGDQINTQPSSAIDLNLTEPGSYEVGFEDPENLCAEASSIAVDYNGTAIPCYGSIRQDEVAPNVFIAEAGPAFDIFSTTYTWFVDGDEVVSSEFNVLIQDPAGISEVCVLIADGMGCSETACLIPLNDEVSCANNLKINSSEIIEVEPQPSNESLVKIEFTDDNGALYSSNGNQTNASILLVSVQPYEEPNRPEEIFAEIILEVSCNLYSADGQPFLFAGEINMALKLP